MIKEWGRKEGDKLGVERGVGAHACPSVNLPVCVCLSQGIYAPNLFELSKVSKADCRKTKQNKTNVFLDPNLTP